MSNGAVGSVAALWRYPVKSMMGEELDASDVSERGLGGARADALGDRETGKLASAKHPRKWSRLFDFGAVFIEPPRGGDPTPAVCIPFPDGFTVTSREPGLGRMLSEALGREVTLAASAPEAATFEEVCGPRSRAPSCTAMCCLKRARRSSPMCRLALPPRRGRFSTFRRST